MKTFDPYSGLETSLTEIVECMIQKDPHGLTLTLTNAHGI